MSSVNQFMAAIDAATFGKVLDPVISNILNPIVELMFAIALVVFTYGVVKYVWGSNDGEARTTAKNTILGGIIGMFIMLSAWGIVNLIASTVKAL